MGSYCSVEQLHQLIRFIPLDVASADDGNLDDFCQIMEENGVDSSICAQVELDCRMEMNDRLLRVRARRTSSLLRVLCCMSVCECVGDEL